MLSIMDNTPGSAERADTNRIKTENIDVESQDRFAWEAEGIAEARAELDAGLYVEMADVRAWVDSLRTETPLPPPPIRRS